MRVLEWNINHRLGHSKIDMPEWVADVISGKDADIFILTEVCSKVPNWEEQKKKAFNSKEYLVFTSNNQGYNNDVLIAVKKEKIEVLHSKSFFADSHKAPDHLQLKCKCKESGQEFTVVGMRIHSSAKDPEKRKELELILNDLNNSEIAIIAGDFNNNRRGYNATNCWHLSGIDQIIKGKFQRMTPNGSSIYTENPYQNNVLYEFPEDHFFVKGIKSIVVKPYDRSFCDKDRKIYKWNNDFQKYLGKQKGKNMYDCVPDPYPDHAILEADFEV